MNMSKCILVFVPNTLEYHKNGFLKGDYKEFDDAVAYYITSDTTEKTSNNSIGTMGTKMKFPEEGNSKIFIDGNGNMTFSKAVGKNYSIAKITYDYEAFKKHDIVEDSNVYGKHFKFISDEIYKSRPWLSDNGKRSIGNTVLSFVLCILILLMKLTTKLKIILSYSSTFSHFEDSVITSKWFIETMLCEKRFTPKLGNIFVAKIIDLVIGIVLLNWLLKNEDGISMYVQNSTEDLISNLKGLLLYLMGSPIGLKLNYAFNKSLGQFFFYHISLWRIFLLGLQPLFVAYFRLLVLPGALGLSFQISMISDLISITTFHVYCIYVYATRLFSLQLMGLRSLWKLFIGRKYNPLRNRVDSCQYSQNQLFIGTLGFTILLFLLPTTTLYYTVFSSFRLVILFIEELSWRMRYFLNTIPVYVIFLWIFNSPSIAGTPNIVWNGFDQNGVLNVEAELNKLPLTSCIRKFLPDHMCKRGENSLVNMFYNTITGTIM
ncbi:phosphatidylinositol glycan anchor biosynthesis class Q isoform X2 [Leptinotarsa decemlineata]|uniref:phosphatidylinositol glycan anchor biosynthesis class Q isoform X2 n=1 Tax=Leptinotarsa decemlineata TaxID=7539 RepID=UPI003D30405F